jgi:glucokinase
MAALLANRSDDPDALELRVGSLGENDRPTAQAIFQAAAEGNGLALEVISNACRVLGWAIAQSVTLLAPEIVILGGGVSLAGEKLFFEPVREAAADYAFPPLAASYSIVPSQLEEEVVLYGALAAAADSATQ